MSEDELVEQLMKAASLEAVRKIMNGKRADPGVLARLQEPVKTWVLMVNRELDETDENDGGGGGGSAPPASEDDDETPEVPRTTVEPEAFGAELPPSLREAVLKRREKQAREGAGAEAVQKSDPKPP